jgi:hypothetical protein
LATVPRTAVAAAAIRDGSFGRVCLDAWRAAVDRAATFLRAVFVADGRAVDVLAGRRAADFFAAARFGARLDGADVRPVFLAAVRARFADPLRPVPFLAAAFFAVFFVARFAKSLLLSGGCARRHAGIESHACQCGPRTRTCVRPQEVYRCVERSPSFWFC